MEEVLKFLTENQIFYFATMEDGRPKVRPFGFMMNYQGKLYMITDSSKRVYKQLQENPFFEICTASQENRWLRLSGKAVFEDNMEAKERAFVILPYLSIVYGDAKNPNMSTFYIDNGAASFNTIEEGECSYIKL